MQLWQCDNWKKNCKGNDDDGQNDHIINDALQFCDRFSDVDESLTDNSDSENSDYEPKSTWEVSDYIVCIDKVGILTDKAISNLPNTFFVVIYAHEMLIQALNLKKINITYQYVMWMPTKIGKTRVLLLINHCTVQN